MGYLVLNSKAEAKARSREAWEAHLGRSKRPEDVTEFLWPVVEHDDGKASLVVDEGSEYLLTPEESSSMVFELQPPLEEM